MKDEKLCGGTSSGAGNGDGNGYGNGNSYGNDNGYGIGVETGHQQVNIFRCVGFGSGTMPGHGSILAHGHGVAV